MIIGETYRNLDTSYVNLGALLKYLRQKGFIGKVCFEAKGYEADVTFTTAHDLQSRENDHITGRISVGNDVLARILIRAYEEGGIISVFGEPDKPKSEFDAVDDSKATDFHEDSVRIPIQKPMGQEESENEEPEPRSVSLKEKLGLPSLPFSFSKSGAKMRETADLTDSEPPGVEVRYHEASLDEWQELLGSVAELVKSIDEQLAAANLNFNSVFNFVRADVVEDYPFLDPNSKVFEYHNGMILMTEQVDNYNFVAGIVECLSLLLDRFQTHPNYDEIRRSVTSRILKLMNQHHAQYDKFLITEQLERIIEY